MTKFRQVFISAGHSNMPGRDRGAAGNGYVEGDLAVEFRKLLVAELKALGISTTVDVDNSILSETIAFFKNKTTSDSIVIDIHWNAAGENATGVETLVPDPASSIEKVLAFDVSDCVSKTLGIVKRGKYMNLEGVRSELDSHHGRLGFMRLVGENILIEMCFISNKNDMKKYQDNKLKLAKELAKVISKHATIGDASTVSDVYTVVAGDNLSKIGLKFMISVTNLKKLNNLTTDFISIGQKLKVK